MTGRHGMPAGSMKCHGCLLHALPSQQTCRSFPLGRKTNKSALTQEERKCRTFLLGRKTNKPTLTQEQPSADIPVLWQLSQAGLELNMSDPGVHISVPFEGSPLILAIVVEARHSQARFCHRPCKVVLEAVDCGHKIQHKYPATPIQYAFRLLDRQDGRHIACPTE